MTEIFGGTKNSASRSLQAWKNQVFALGPGSTHVKETLANGEEKDGPTELQGICRDKIAAKLGRKLLKLRVKPASGSSN